jgi:hypothetical protein
MANGVLGAGEDVGISSSSSLARFLRAMLPGPLFPADMLGLNGELCRYGQQLQCGKLSAFDKTSCEEVTSWFPRGEKVPVLF